MIQEKQIVVPFFSSHLVSVFPEKDDDCDGIDYSYKH